MPYSSYVAIVTIQKFSDVTKLQLHVFSTEHMFVNYYYKGSQAARVLQ